MVGDPLPCPTGAELLAARGYPYLPLRLRHRVPQAWHPVRDGDEAARYQYEAANGKPLFECIRFHLREGHPAAPDKAFLTRRACGGERWAWGLDGVETVLYRLPRVRAAAATGERVYVVEGEKDVHALEALGLTATTAPLGALQWTERHAEMLRGADVVVIPDNDRVGRVHAARVMALLRARARSTALLLLPVGPREDVSDWLAAGNGVAELLRQADAAPRNPSPARVAELLELPPCADLLDSSPTALRTLMIDPPPAVPDPHPAFARSLSAFSRLGVAVLPLAEPGSAGLPAAHATYRAVAAALRDADHDVVPLLDDASLLDRTAYALGILAPLLRASVSPAPPAPVCAPDAPGTAFLTAPLARVVRTRWDWDAYLRDPGASHPPESDDAWLLYLPPSGPLQVRRLHALPAILLEESVRPLTRERAVEMVAEQVQGDSAQIQALVHAQIDGLRDAGLLHCWTVDGAGQTVDEMRTLLLADEAPQGEARSMFGAISRTLLVARAYADSAGEAPDHPYRLHRLDLAVDALEQLLDRARRGHSFSAELDGYWAAVDVGARLRSLEPLLDVLQRALGRGTHSLPPVVL